MIKNKLLCFGIVMVITICFNGSVFAASGFVFKPLVGYNASILDRYDHNISEGSTTARLGYQFASSNTAGFTLFFDVGYALNVQLKRNNYNHNSDTDKKRKALLTHNYVLGLMPTVNIGNFSIGIGGGVKVPFATTDITFTPNSTDRTTTLTGVTSSDGDYRFTPYAKFVVDYSLYVGSNVAFVIAADFTYDFQLEYYLPTHTNPENFNIGLQLGMKFGKKVDNREYAKAGTKQKVVKERKQKVIKAKQENNVEPTQVVAPKQAVTPVAPQSQNIVIDIKVNGDRVAPSNQVPVAAPVPVASQVPQAPQPIVITVTQPPVQPPVQPAPVQQVPVQQVPVQVAPAQQVPVQQVPVQVVPAQ